MRTLENILDCCDNNVDIYLWSTGLRECSDPRFIGTVKELRSECSDLLSRQVAHFHISKRAVDIWCRID